MFSPVCFIRRVVHLAIILGLVLSATAQAQTAQAKSPPAGESGRRELEQEVEQLKEEADELAGNGKFDEALKVEKSVLELTRQLHRANNAPVDHEDVVDSFFRLANAYGNLGDRHTKTEFLEQALEMALRLYPEQEFPDGHPLIASCLECLAEEAWVQQDMQASDKFFKRSLEMRRRLYPAEDYPNGHPEVALSLHYVANAARREGREEEGSQGLREAVTMFRHFYNEQDEYDSIAPDRRLDLLGVFEMSLRDLARLNQFNGRYAQALGLYEERGKLLRYLYKQQEHPHWEDRIAANYILVGELLFASGDLDESRKHFREAITLCQQQDSANARQGFRKCLRWLALIEQDSGNLIEAYDLIHKSLEIAGKDRRLEKRPREVAHTRNVLASILTGLGEYERARANVQRAIEIRRQIASETKAPGDRRLLAISINELGRLLFKQGEYRDARKHLEQVVTIYEELFDTEGYPNGHPELLISQQNLAIARRFEGDEDAAVEVLEKVARSYEAIAKSNQLAFDVRHQGMCLSQLGACYKEKDQLKRATKHLSKALCLYESAYPAEQFPDGHRDIAICLGEIAQVHRRERRYQHALRFCDEALAMFTKLYPKASYPRGHNDLVQVTNTNAALLYHCGDHEASVGMHMRSTAMREQLAHDVVPGLSEAEGLNFIRYHLQLPSTLIQAWRASGRSEDELYKVVWNYEGMWQRTMQQRQLAIRQTGDAALQELVDSFRETSRELARLLQSGADSQEVQDHLKTLNKRKESAERKLAAELPGYRDELARLKRPYHQLVKRVPAQGAYIDFVRHEERNEANEADVHYSAFVMRPERPVTMVQLDEGSSIDRALLAFRSAILNGQATAKAAERVRQLIWEPIEDQLPDETETVFIRPDGLLNTVPWPALPGRNPDSILLEDYALAVVPSGHFLLDQLLKSSEAFQGGERLLAVGDVAFDAEVSEEAPSARSRSAVRGGEVLKWSPLPATGDELEGIGRLADGQVVQELTRVEATIERVSEALPQARWAHFATHGYFANPRIQSALQSIDDAERYFTEERVGAASRNPSLLSGLVLAGANSPRPRDELGVPYGDGGILTAEAISMLPLDGLELAVLSACETGLGDVAGGEGVLGLQRAFHLAGTRNVVASLWKVDDEATAALMQVFYHKLWSEGKTPLEALREAQLTIYYHPELVEQAGAARGRIDFSKTSPLRPSGSDDAKADPRLWAAFVLSGAGD